jgi:hypothetical protein
MSARLSEIVGPRFTAEPGYLVPQPVPSAPSVAVDENVVLGVAIVVLAVVVKCGANWRRSRRTPRTGTGRASRLPVKAAAPLASPSLPPAAMPVCDPSELGQDVRSCTARAAAWDVLLMLEHSRNASASIRRDVVASLILRALRGQEERIRSYMKPSIN